MNTKNFVLTGVLSLLAVFSLIFGVNTLAQKGGRDSAGGQGSIVTQDAQGKKVRRQFAFNAKRSADGTVSGHAILHNASFDGANGKKYAASFDISCLRIYGNTAVLGGFIKRTNDPNLVDAAYFIVQDNGEPGKDSDKISSVYFFDNDPNTTGSPALCEQTPPDAFPLMTIDSGNIRVTSDATP